MELFRIFNRFITALLRLEAGDDEDPAVEGVPVLDDVGGSVCKNITSSAADLCCLYNERTNYEKFVE